MTEADLELLKSSIDTYVQIVTSDGEHMVVKVISVFDEDSDADMFYEVVSTSHPHLYAKKEQAGGYSIQLDQIVSVKPAS